MESGKSSGQQLAKPRHAIINVSADETITGDRKEKFRSRNIWVAHLTGLDGQWEIRGIGKGG